MAAIIVGVLLMLAGMEPPPRPPEPARSFRPATEQEKRQQDAELLREEMDRLWRQHQQEDAHR